MWLTCQISTSGKADTSVATTVEIVRSSTSYACTHCRKSPPGSRREATAA